ncbi:DUF4233 domain-containing protein [Corynebacterium sp. Marseille-P4321]|uniref:DUF4233 domain-containing protein n=1 Tax=Corynebacterium sp. Marseille-P4321 TaxID=2736603 RepID=UPI000892E9B6|nr:DUF4233 domain-containing protein [Corynebacterium sp. Marseille-P4321]OEX92071.1 hypothetical protein A0K93_11305 [Corynebacterium sp. BCW_4722]
MSSRFSPRSRRPEPEMGPLGPGKAPVKDPIQGLHGVLVGTLIMEAITIFLILTVILKVNDGQYWTTFNWVYVTIVGLAHVVATFFQKKPWALWLDLALQIPLLIGFFVHWSVPVVGVIFGFVWFLIVKMRSEILQRMRHGYLVTQHLGTSEDPAR